MSALAGRTRTRRFAGGESEALPALAAREVEVGLSVNGEVWLSFHCSPADLEALALGFLYNEGFIQSAQEVASIQVCEAGDHIDAWLSHAQPKPAHWSRTSGCQGGVVQPGAKVEPPRRAAAALSTADLFARVDVFMTALAERDTLRQGVHTSMLLDRLEASLVCMDIGRHNTLDKIAGMLLTTPRELGEATLITTGRISEEMVNKAARMGIALVISLHSASDLAIAAAEKWQICLVGHARRTQVDIYTYSERVMAEGDKRWVDSTATSGVQ